MSLKTGILCIIAQEFLQSVMEQEDTIVTPILNQEVTVTTVLKTDFELNITKENFSNLVEN